jgi:hypothetical protein
MALPNYIQKTLTMKPEVTKIFEDLEKWQDYCKFNMIEFNPADLYKSKEYKDFQRGLEYQERKSRREARAARQY